MKLLLSGFIGAFIATLLSICYSYIAEQVRHRREIMIKVVEWVDDSIRKKKLAQERYRYIKPKLIDWCNQSPELRRVLVISRDRVGFAHPAEAWQISPLPDATLNTI